MAQDTTGPDGRITDYALPEHVIDRLETNCKECVGQLEKAADDIRAGLVPAVQYMLANPNDDAANDAVRQLLEGLDRVTATACNVDAIPEHAEWFAKHGLALIADVERQKGAQS